jgi:hypothetical protein
MALVRPQAFRHDAVGLRKNAGTINSRRTARNCAMEE